jgi:opacity protein-like surface antigen
MAQDSQIRGFGNVDVYLQDDQLNFGFGEWNLFITSDLNDKFSFLGETVFKYSPSSSTHFSVGVERLIINFNYKGNHSVLVGKHHTPVNFWNDTYHHGRVFFPTVGRPLLFAAGIIPIHTTGIAFQGLNLGKLKWGYNLMVGNGIGSNEIKDNDKYKSVTAAVYMQPANKLKVGVSYYNDVISQGAELRGDTAIEKINQQLFTGSVSYFGRRFEVLAEGTIINNNGQNSGVAKSYATYLYAGVRLKDKFIPYGRVDYLNYQSGETYFGNEETLAYVGGIRYEITYLIAVKLEYQYTDTKVSDDVERLSAQIAIGF